MPDPITHAVAAPVAGGAISTIIAIAFGIEPNALLAAFVGAWIGTALLESASFKKSLALVVVGTVAAAYLIPLVLNLWPDYSKLSLSAIVGFIVVYFHKLVLSLAAKALERLFGKVGS